MPVLTIHHSCHVADIGCDDPDKWLCLQYTILVMFQILAVMILTCACALKTLASRQGMSTAVAHSALRRDVTRTTAAAASRS